jgi:hypothetical protein
VKPSDFKRFGLQGRKARARALAKLEEAGLIKVEESDGRDVVVTFLRAQAS